MEMQRTSGIFLIFLSVVAAFRSICNSRRTCNANDDLKQETGEQLNSIERDKYSVAKKNRRLRLNDMRGFEALTDSFLGGTVGVFSVAFLLELRKVADTRLDGCPYCMGNGEILCASCYGTGTETTCACRLCNGRGLVKCINCKGDGRITPILLQSKAVRDPDYATDNIGSGINGA